MVSSFTTVADEREVLVRLGFAENEGLIIKLNILNSGKWCEIVFQVEACPLWIVASDKRNRRSQRHV